MVSLSLFSIIAKAGSSSTSSIVTSVNSYFGRPLTVGVVEYSIEQLDGIRQLCLLLPKRDPLVVY